MVRTSTRWKLGVKMVTDIATYLMHIAPSLAVVVFLLVYVNKRLEKTEDRIMAMLERCLEHLYDENSR